MDDEDREPEMLESREALAKMLGIDLATDEKLPIQPTSTANKAKEENETGERREQEQSEDDY